MNSSESENERELEEVEQPDSTITRRKKRNEGTHWSARPHSKRIQRLCVESEKPKGGEKCFRKG